MQEGTQEVPCLAGMLPSISNPFYNHLVIDVVDLLLTSLRRRFLSLCQECQADVIESLKSSWYFNN